MSKLEKIDKNFKVNSSIEREGLTFYDIKEEPFSVHGLLREDDAWVRMPTEVASSVNEGVAWLYRHTAGGRVRFVTDSPYIAIKSIQPKAEIPALTPLPGKSGFDLYVGYGENMMYRCTFRPDANERAGFEAYVDFPSHAEKRLITINFPLYNGVDELYIGVKEGSLLEKAPDYTIKTPFVYYGSSITQGAAASRPGNEYQGFLSRRFDADFINLGFSGSARGEDLMAEYIANLDMSLFVYDYDYNAPSAEHLEATHERMFLTVREKHPDIPIIILSRPNYKVPDDDARCKVIKKTYENAVARGDDNVYYVSGKELMALCGAEGTIDNIHPNDLGFFSMAQTLTPVIERIIAEGKLKFN